MDSEASHIDLDEIPFVTVPKVLRTSFEADKAADTRAWTWKGDVREFREWLEVMNDAFPCELIPLQWAPTFVEASRTAIKKRINNGQLTCFTFHLMETRITILGKLKYEETRTKFEFLSISECESWHDILRRRSGMLSEAEQIELMEFRDTRRQGYRRFAKRLLSRWY